MTLHNLQREADLSLVMCFFRAAIAASPSS
jgi:hypothetical protein